VNLQLLLTEKQVSDSYKKLKRKKYRKNFSDLKRFSDLEQRHLNALGEYLKQINSGTFFKTELKRFSFSPYSGLKIKKANGKPRPLLIPSPKDRIVLTAIFPRVRIALESDLKKYNALGLGIKSTEEVTECKRVLSAIQKQLKDGDVRFVLKLDFKDFFSSIERSILLRKLGRHFKGLDQRRVYRLIKQSIENKIEADADFHGTFGNLHLRTRGVPQGLSYSPLLASFYALPLDKKVISISGCKGYRYLDDMIILAKTEVQAKRAFNSIDTLSKKLKLNLHPLKEGSKTQLLDIHKLSFEFLGIGISTERLFIPKEAVEDFKKTFEREIVNKEIVGKYDFKYVMKAYREFAGGWVNHYKNLCPEHFEEVQKELLVYLDGYIEKHRNRKTIGKFFGPQRLTLSGNFLRIKS
jgi:retron-type reverse transcriptase